MADPNHPKLQSLLSQERLKLGTSNLPDKFTWSIRTQTIKNFREKGAWAYPGTVQIFRVPPIISGTGKATNFKCGRCRASMETKAPQLFGRKGSMGVSKDFSNSLSIPPVMPGTRKATNFKFCRYI